MHLRNLENSELVLIGLLAFVGASVCCTTPGGPSPGNSRPLGDLDISTLQDRFRNPPEDSKIMVRWWWFGPAVTTEELDRELHAMKAAGIGGFEVQPVYPLTLDDPSKGLINLRYLSPQFLAAVTSTARTARALGLRMDMTMGSGWPFGGPHITPELAAEELRCRRIPIKPGARTVTSAHLQPDERFLAAFVASGDGKHFDASSTHQLTRQTDGSFELPRSPAGPRVLLFFAAGLTGQQVKRAAFGAEGNVLDHYSRAALQKHLEAVGGPLLAAGGGTIRAMFSDSLEVLQSDWSTGFLQEFQSRRGYDLAPYLPALIADSGPQTAAVRHDWGQTLSELLDDNYFALFQRWCHEHQVLARVQAYGEPPAELSSYRFVDLPEGEAIGGKDDEPGQWNRFSAARWASSAGHLYGAPVISAEAWTWIHWLPFRATPLDFKATADEYFLEGVNQFVAHGYPYSPPGVPEPGWHFYAAGALNPHNPWWFAMPDLASYLQRGSFMLRQGRPVSDIAVYLPTHDAWASLPPGHVDLLEAIGQQFGSALLPSLLEAGYNVDFFDDQTLAEKGRVEKGKLIFGQQAFSVVVLPGLERIPPETLATLGAFAQSGGTLISSRRLPSRGPGFLHQESESAEVARQVGELFRKPSARGHFVADESRPFGDELNRLCPPDVDFSPRSPDFGFVHRHTDSLEIYFIANTSNRRLEGTASFRVSGRKPEWWDLFTGEVTSAETLSSSGGRTVLILSLEPYSSRLVVFGDREAPKPPALMQAHLPEPLDISHGWQLTFEGARKEIFMETLRSWTELEGLQFFSGHATYKKKLYAPAGFLQDGVRAELSFGEGTPIPVRQKSYFQAWLDSPVREAAEVYVNGHRVGTIWHPPYELDVTPFLHAGQNELRIVVGNLAVNEMAASPVPNRADLIARYGDRFQDEGSNLVKTVPSGLTGPIQLIARGQRATGRNFP